ncbi:hypothetical protein, conserved [Babesia ovata]|uniref:Uncharacterized protein n=1 Tax=Babesia ovata TaxID=189622 RepID=A0A2H6KDY7_9APIC|nr:uncharacterized protein BOVATA_026980 [Babesia ovata]GBE61205.1 hypothetical protein, conserved [Babesia ovata]
MVYNSLTDIPRNLKEGIDWLIALKGDDAKENLAAMGDAIHKFLADKPVGKMELPALEKVKSISKEFLEKPELKCRWPIKNMLEKLYKPMNKNISGCAKFFRNVDESDYKNVLKARGVKPEDISKDLRKVVHGTETFLDDIKNPDQYKSAYSSEATWEASCAKDPEACAVVLVGIAPMLFGGLRALREASHDESHIFSRSKNKGVVGSVLEALGYNVAERRPNMSGSYVFKAVENVKLKMLITLYDLAGLWAFY